MPFSSFGIIYTAKSCLIQMITSVISGEVPTLALMP